MRCTRRITKRQEGLQHRWCAAGHGSSAVGGPIGLEAERHGVLPSMFTCHHVTGARCSPADRTGGRIASGCFSEGRRRARCLGGRVDKTGRPGPHIALCRRIIHPSDGHDPPAACTNRGGKSRPSPSSKRRVHPKKGGEAATCGTVSRSEAVVGRSHGLSRLRRARPCHPK